MNALFRPTSVRPSWRTIAHALRAALALCTALLAGCEALAPPTPTPEPVTIAFIHPAVREGEMFDELIQDFQEEYPHIIVERKASRTAEVEALVREGAADVFLHSGSAEFFANLREDGQVLNLTPLIQADEGIDLDDIYPSLLEPYTIQGKVWAIPGGTNFAAIYYNADLFDRYSVAYPEPGWTWDDLLLAAAAVRDPGRGIYGLVGEPFVVIEYVYLHGGRIVDDWHAPTRLKVDDPETIEAVEWYAALIHDHDVMPSPREIEIQGDGHGSGYVWWQGKAGMYHGVFPYERGGQTWPREARWQMNWGVAPLPRDAHAATIGMVWAYAIAADTQHPEACWEWVSYLSRRPPPFMMPARRSLAEGSDFEEEVGAKEAALARTAIEEALILSNLQAAAVGPEASGWDETLEAILDGDVEAEPALIELQRRVDAQ